MFGVRREALFPAQPSYPNIGPPRIWNRRMSGSKALFMTVWCPDSRSVESNCGIPRG